MRIKGKRILSLALAAVMTVSFPVMDSVHAQELNEAAKTAVGARADKPTLPNGFGNPLEDNGGVTVAELATAVQMAGFGTAIDVTTQWNDKNKGHASINNAPDLFARTAFTVLLDVRQDSPTADNEGTEDKRAALSIGKAENNIHLLTYSGKLGYGDSVAGGGASANMTDLAGVQKDAWNAIAMTYEEKDGANGHVIVYVNGQKAGEVADIGFKLSAMSDLTATLARSFSTNYLQQGRYDNLVVGNSVLDEATAKAETAYRKQQKENVPDYRVSIKGSDVEAAANNINGLTYKGFGMLNGNSTSNLLLDYKYENPDKYNEMMEYLFGGDYPLFTHIKMEMGNDGNNSTGAEACTMRYETEEADASRSPGFVMAADAKKINPNVKVSILRWEMPKWVADKTWSSAGGGYEAAYKWYKETVFDAYEKYGYMVDFINPDKNETGNPDTSFIKWFSNRVKGETEFPAYIDAGAQAAYKNIRIIASDENKGLKIVPAMREDNDLYNAVDIIGFHYRTNATDDYVTMADVDDKEVWYSEGCATFGYTELQENKKIEYGADSIGGYQSPLALMDSFITAFASSRRTHYMFQPAIGSFYEGIQYGHKELLSARDPWSGYIHYDPALYMLEHFAKFAKMGWEDSEPAANDIWRAIPGATSPAFAGSDNEHATAGINGNAGYMTLASPDKKNFSVVIVNNTQNEKSFHISAQDMNVTAEKLNLWVTETDKYLQDKGEIVKEADSWNLTVPAYSVSTATTLDTEPERAPKDDIHNEDRAVLDTDKSGKINGVTTDNVLYADDFEYKEEPANYLAERGNEPRYMLDAHGAWVVENGRLKQELADGVAQWNGGDPSTIVGDFRWMDYATSVDVEIPESSAEAWARLTVRSQSGMNWDNSGYTLSISREGEWRLHRINKRITGGSVPKNADGKYNLKVGALGDTVSIIINGQVVFSYQDDVPMLSGRVKLSSTWSQVYFDNLLVETVSSGIPYALSMIDGQDDAVAYEGNWKIENPGSGSADNWYRTMSVTSAANASFSFPVKGSGFAILGTNDGTAKLDIYVDGVLKAENTGTHAAPVRGEVYSLADLPDGEHEVKVVVKAGKLQIDALYALSARLGVNGDALQSVKTEIPSIPYVCADKVENAVQTLPKQVEVVTFAGKTVNKDVVWNRLEAQFDGTEFEKTYIVGTVLGGTSALGLPLVVTVPVEIMIPANTVYFIDSVEGTPQSNATTEPYETVKAQVGGKLLNKVSDQLKTDSNSWGLVDEDAQTRGYDDTTDMMATGIYGKNNEKGETLSYAFTLPAGSYKLLSGHQEWWGQNRPMAASLSFDSKTQTAGTINLNGSTNTLVNSTKFTLDSEQLVTYTLTAQDKQAPVISWLGVVKVEFRAAHVHEYVKAVDNGDGTHLKVCKDGDDVQNEAHSLVYKDSGNGKHAVTCKVCSYNKTEDHIYSNNVCTQCNAVKETAEDNKPKAPSAPVLSTLTNESKGVKVSWKKVSDASGYNIYRKAGNGKFQKVKTIDKAATISWTDSGVKGKNGTTYQYQVSAYKGNLESKASKTKTIIRLTANKLTGVKNVKGKKLQVKWSKNKKSGGYEIQYSVNKKFKGAKAKKIAGAKKVTKTFSGLKKGKTYYVRVRCYKTSGKAKYVSCWSAGKKIKIKK